MKKIRLAQVEQEKIERQRLEKEKYVRERNETKQKLLDNAHLLTKRQLADYIWPQSYYYSIKHKTRAQYEMERHNKTQLIELYREKVNTNYQ